MYSRSNFHFTPQLKLMREGMRMKEAGLAARHGDRVTASMANVKDNDGAARAWDERVYNLMRRRICHRK